MRRGHDVVDTEGHKIGELEAIYVDTSTDRPAFATVRVGMPTRHRLTFVPLDHATVGPGYVKVSFDRKQVKDAPSIDTEGELPAGDEGAISRHYGLPFRAGAGGDPASTRHGKASRQGNGTAGCSRACCLRSDCQLRSSGISTDSAIQPFSAPCNCRPVNLRRQHAAVFSRRAEGSASWNRLPGRRPSPGGHHVI